MMEYSDVTKELYHVEDKVFFRNLLQSAYYIHNGAKIYDIFTDSKGMLVFVFSKKAHKRLKQGWHDSKPVDDSETGGAENG